MSWPSGGLAGDPPLRDQVVHAVQQRRIVDLPHPRPDEGGDRVPRGCMLTFRTAAAGRSRRRTSRSPAWRCGRGRRRRLSRTGIRAARPRWAAGRREPASSLHPPAAGWGCGSYTVCSAASHRVVVDHAPSPAAVVRDREPRAREVEDQDHDNEDRRGCVGESGPETGFRPSE